MHTKWTTKHMVSAAMIAALYTALCLATPALSYGMLQVRVAEALALLPVFSPVAVVGVTLGCAVTNLVGFLTGADILGYLDIFFGTAATLVAACLSYLLRNVRVGRLPVASAIPPILLNAVIIGGEFAVLETGRLQPQAWLINGIWIGAGQAVACLAVGLPMVAALQRSGVAARFLPERLGRAN